MAGAILLCEIIAQGGDVTAAAYRNRVGYAALVRAGLIAEGGIAQSVLCNDCGTTHDAEIVFEDGHYGYWCPEAGFVRVGRAHLVTLKPDLSVLVARLADLLACKRCKATPLGGTTWRIGSVETAAGDVTIYLHPRLQHAGDLMAIEMVLLSEGRPTFRLVLTAGGSLRAPDSKTICLDDLIEIDPVSGAIDHLANPGTLVGAPQEHRGGRPNMYGDRLVRIIAARDQSGEALPGRNADAKAVLEAYLCAHSGESPPSLPTIRRYLSDFRRGS
ncbi:MAG: hypothetical protein AAF501_13220 [Pseudomonadota bacterium]